MDGELETGDGCSELAEARVDILVAAVNLLDVAYNAGALGRHGGQEHGDAGADVGRAHAVAAEGEFVVVAYYNGAVGVAEYNLRAHVDEAVNEEEAALEHLLVDEHAAAALCGHNEEHAQEVGGEARPWGVGDVHYRAVESGVDHIALLGGDMEVVALLLHGDAQTAEALGDDAEILYANVLDGDGALRYGRHADEAAHLDHVGEYAVYGGCGVADGSADGEEIGAYTPHAPAHCLKQARGLLHVGLAGGVVDCGGAVGICRGHQYVGGAGHRGFVKEHVASLERAPFGHGEEVCPLFGLIFAGGSEVEETLDVGVDLAAAYLVASRLGEVGLAEASQQRADHKHRAAQRRAALDEIVAERIVQVAILGLEVIAPFFDAFHADSHLLEQGNEVFHITYLRDIGNFHRLRGEECGGDYLQCFVFGALRGDFARQFAASFYYE